MPGDGGASQSIDLSSEPRFRVGAASIDPVSHEAAFNGSAERIQPQNLKVLIALAQRRGRVVTRDELIRRCWDGRVIGDDVINRAISTLRQFAARAGGFQIETVPRAGYRLVEGSRGIRKPALLTGAIALLAVIGLLVGIPMATRKSQRDTGLLTIGLLPFKADASDALARNLAFAARDSVAHALSQTRFALAESEQGNSRQPDADFLLSADVSGTPRAITATVRMEQAAQHNIVYSHQFTVPRDQAWSLPEFIGPQVAGSLGWTEPMLRADHRYPSNPKIVADLLQRTDVQQVSWLSGYEHALRDARAAPGSAVAQIALAYNAGFFLPNFRPEQQAAVLGSGREAAARGEQLAPDFGDSYIPWCLLHSRALLAACEDRLREGLRHDPDAPWAGYYLADRIKDAGRLNEALDLVGQSLAADPFIPEKIALNLRLLEATGGTDSAERLYQQARRWWPGHNMMLWDRLYGLMTDGNFVGLERFAAELHDQGSETIWPGVGEFTGAIATHVLHKDLAAVRRKCLGQGLSFQHDLCMVAFAQLGDNQDAMAFADAAFPDRVGRSAAEQEKLWLERPFVTDTDILTGPGAASLRRDPRYLALAQRLGLLAYWRSGRLPDFCRTPTPEPICKALHKQ